MPLADIVAVTPAVRVPVIDELDVLLSVGEEVFVGALDAEEVPLAVSDPELLRVPV